MRSADEIQFAHDVLVGIILGEAELRGATKEDLKNITNAAAVLCWVLRHDHNTSFGENLKRILDALPGEFVKPSDN
jgi:hypothetical protein